MIIDDALQKWYSALKHLSDYDEKASFIDNISDLDCFFSEYRNITFVLKKKLSDIGKLEIYSNNLNKYLISERWLKDLRNIETKEHPTSLLLYANIRIFYPNVNECVKNINVKIDGNCSFNILKNEFTNIIKEYQNDIIYFSVNYKHCINNQDIDLFDNLSKALYNMKLFLDNVIKDLKDTEKSELFYLSNKLFENVYYAKMQTVKDYIYYKNTNVFEASSSITLKASEDNDQYIFRREKLSMLKRLAPESDCFYNFTLTHAIIQKIDIAPACCVIFEDGYFDLMAKSSDIKTTYYRNIDDLSNRILNEKIKEVYIVMPMTRTEIPSGKVTNMLVSSMVDMFGNKCEYIFDEGDLNDIKKIIGILKSRNNRLICSEKIMSPIVKAFELKKLQK